MPTTLDASLDWQLWDNVEEVTFRSNRSNSATPYTISSALGRAPNWKELQASNGAYTGQDKVWNLPASLVTAAGAVGIDLPKPGDTIIDESDATWTVLQVALNTWKTVWRLMCRNLSLAYGLRDTISIERGRLTRDAAGSPLTTWEAVYEDIPARVQLVSQAPVEWLGVSGAQGDYMVVVDRQLTLSMQFERVKFGDEYLEIKAYRNPQRIDELPILDCLKAP